MKSFTLKQRLGVILLDWLPFQWRLMTDPLLIRNRTERLEPAPEGDGVRCRWQWTSDLHPCRVYPSLGRRLMERVLSRWPIRLRDLPTATADPPLVSFIIGHRGVARLPHLLMTLKSIAAQEGLSYECLVVEQSVMPEVRQQLPSWVRYLHTPPPRPDMPYSRSWAFNIAARQARGELLVFHDNDMLLPARYGAEMVRLYRAGYEAMNLKRFIFYLGEAETGRIFREQRLESGYPAATVVQNLEGGGSLAVTRNAFLEIGGFDESFVGWGGEDNEFWERAATRRLWPYMYLPIIHLWHEAQPEKVRQARETTRLYEQRAAIAPHLRIRELAGRRFGYADELDPPFRPAAGENGRNDGRDR